METTRIAPGEYKIDTDAGAFQVSHIVQSASRARPRTDAWFITWPGEQDPDETADTLREAKALIQRRVES